MRLFLVILFSLFSSGAFAKDHFKSIHIAELETLQAKGAAVFDANVDSTRNSVGLIHGARALSSYENFAESELPPQKTTPLVFYCANTMCTASHVAAERAVKLGYKDVSVMVDGVYGWKKAGKALDPYPAKAAGKTSEISPVEAKKQLDAKTALLLDVRETEECHEVIPGARSLPMSKQGSQEWKTALQGLDKGKTVLVHCAAGRRAEKVAAALAQEGFHTAFFKGPDQWKAAGLAVEPGPAN